MRNYRNKQRNNVTGVTLKTVTSVTESVTPDVTVAQVFEKQPTKFPGVFKLKQKDVNVIDQHKVERVTNVDHAIFDGKGHGVPVQGYVLIAGSVLRGEPSYVVTEHVWRQRLNNKCSHGLAGWSCKG